MDRPAVWFIPFCLLIAVLTFPLAIRDPWVSGIPLVAATAFGAHMLWHDRAPGRMPNPLLTALLVILALVTLAVLALAVAIAL
jgi:hypothetical protein